MRRSTVAIVDDFEVARSLPATLDLLGDLSDLVTGKHVAVKPNDTRATGHDRTACTHADTVRALVRYLKRFKPQKITITGGSGAAETDEVFRLMGIDAVIREEGVAFFDHNRPPFHAVRLRYGPQQEIMVNPHVFAYDTLISLAQHKVHYGASVTLTMKNIAMSYPAADYYGHPREQQIHPHDFFKDLHGFIAGVFQRFPAQLGIVVGHPAMVGTGPIGGETFESGLTIASRDCVAADYVGARLLGVRNVGHIVEAESLGLGHASIAAIDIAGLPLEEAERLFYERAPKVAVAP
jgi:uncharacterized protein (DUF362 family)